MRQKLINVFKFNELSRSIQDNYVKEYLEKNHEAMMQNLANRFFQDKGFLGISTTMSWNQFSADDYYADSSLTTTNLVLLNSFFTISDYEKIESIKLKSGHMGLGYTCCQPKVTVTGHLLPAETKKQIENRLEVYWKECCTEYLTRLTKELDEETVRQALIDLNQDFLESGALVP